MPPGSADVKLVRFCYSPGGTFGNLLWEGRPVEIFTVERPWLNNAPRTSCIPEGIYPCHPRKFFRKGYDAIEVAEVPGRSTILFHIANVPSDVEGCIAPGLALGSLRGEWSVTASSRAFAVLMESWGGKSFRLEVTSIRGPESIPWKAP